VRRDGALSSALTGSQPLSLNAKATRAGGSMSSNLTGGGQQASPAETRSQRLETVVARCREGLEDYGARRAEWWCARLTSASKAARQARSLAFGRKPAVDDPHSHADT
jgi:hypothetical protein